MGGLSLKPAVNEWDNAKGIILNPNYEEAARQYLAYVVRKLGAEPVYPTSEEATSGLAEEERYWYIDQFVRALKNIALEYNRILARYGEYDAIETIMKTAFKGYIEGIEVKAAGDYSRLIIRRQFIRNGQLEVQNLAQLYEGLKTELAEYLPEELKCLLNEEYLTYGRDKYGYYISIDERLLAALMGLDVECTDQGPTIPSHEYTDEENNE